MTRPELRTNADGGDVGGTAVAAGKLVKELKGNLLGYVMLLELEFLKGRDKLEAPIYTLLSGQS